MLSTDTSHKSLIKKLFINVEVDNRGVKNTHHIRPNVFVNPGDKGKTIESHFHLKLRAIIMLKQAISLIYGKVPHSMSKVSRFFTVDKEITGSWLIISQEKSFVLN